LKNNYKVIVVCFFLLFFLIGNTEIGIAESFPFRSLNIGSPLPQSNLTHYKGQDKLAFSSFKGKHFVVLFWGADSGTKEKRSVDSLKQLGELLPFLEERKIPFITINILGDSAETIDQVLKKSKVTVPVYFDSGNNLYKDFGMFVMPCFLLADKDGKIAAALGFSRDIRERLEGEVDILLGAKNRSQVEGELHPEEEHKSEEEKGAHRHLNMGRTMIKRGQVESAIREFENALKLDAGLAEAHIELGCLYLESGKTQEAAAALTKGLDLAPDSLQGQICDGVLMAKEGDLPGAVQSLQGLLFRNARNAELHYALGTLYEQQKQVEKAAAEYRKAYELLMHETTMEKTE
jgi:tetratricopeptide (TPR) repeat protein